MPYGCRAWFERFRPGGWWRRDLLLAVLEETYPRWLTAAEIGEICRAIRPDWATDVMGPDGGARRSLGRLHSLGLVDRIGQRGGFKGRLPGRDWKGGWLRCPGYRYRLIRRTNSTS